MSTTYEAGGHILLYMTNKGENNEKNKSNDNFWHTAGSYQDGSLSS